MTQRGPPRQSPITPRLAPGRCLHEGPDTSSRTPARVLVLQILPGPQAPVGCAQARPVITQVTRSQSTGKGPASPPEHPGHRGNPPPLPPDPCAPAALCRADRQETQDSPASLATPLPNTARRRTSRWAAKTHSPGPTRSLDLTETDRQHCISPWSCLLISSFSVGVRFSYPAESGIHI